MPVVGKSVNRVNPKAILITGLLVNSIAMFMMMRFNLNVDIDSVIWARIVLGFGMGMVFIPLNTLAFGTIPKEEMSNATSIFSLLRNLAGSFGIAFMTTVLARRAQFHQFRLAEHLNPYDMKYQMWLNKIMYTVGAKTGIVSAKAGEGVIYSNLMRESNLFAFGDAFYIAGVIMLCVVPLVFLLKKPRHSSPDVMAH
jgi:DHA2 family multidrug resistance protein